MDQVTIHLTGGLGNQMFQYAAARAIALRCNAAVKLDLSWFGTDPMRRFALQPFAIEAQFPDAGSASSTSGSRVTSRLLRRARRALGSLGLGRGIYAETSFDYEPRIAHVEAPVELEGYFQSEKYFSSVCGQIRQDFSLRTLPSDSAWVLLKAIIESDAICVHVRRGDYISNPTANAYHGVCSMEYYLDALKMASSGLDNPHCFIFSDDPEWVRTDFRIGLPMTVVDIHSADDAHEDLRLMAACKRYVIANSSLSWWGAWLGQSEEKMVIAPKRWFNHGAADTTDLIPAKWTRI